jgi:hypothetical protein
MLPSSQAAPAVPWDRTGIVQRPRRRRARRGQLLGQGRHQRTARDQHAVIMVEHGHASTLPQVMPADRAQYGAAEQRRGERHPVQADNAVGRGRLRHWHRAPGAQAVQVHHLGPVRHGALRAGTAIVAIGRDPDAAPVPAT